MKNSFSILVQVMILDKDGVTKQPKTAHRRKAMELLNHIKKEGKTCASKFASMGQGTGEADVDHVPDPRDLPPIAQ